MTQAHLSCDRRQWLIGAAAAAAHFMPAVAGRGANPTGDSPAADKPHDVSWLADVQRAPDPPTPMPTPLSALLVDGAGRPITTRDAWLERRAALVREWHEILGKMQVGRVGPPKLEIVESETVGKIVRQRVRYDIEPGLSTEAYLLRPERADGRLPGAVVFHSTVDHSIRQPAGVEGPPEKHFGLKLAERGFIAFCPRNFLWPENGRIAAQQEADKHRLRHPRATGMSKMLYDAVVAVDILATQPQVDSSRLCAVGHSLGAKEVLYLAAFDQRIKATVSSEGGIGTKFSNWDAAWYLGDQIKRPDFSHEHHELLALAAPRPFLLVGGESADGDASWPFIAAALPVYRLFGEPARLGLLNHRRGHAVPADVEPKIYEWLTTYTT